MCKQWILRFGVLSLLNGIVGQISSNCKVDLVLACGVWNCDLHSTVSSLYHTNTLGLFDYSNPLAVDKSVGHFFFMFILFIKNSCSNDLRLEYNANQNEYYFQQYWLQEYLFQLTFFTQLSYPPTKNETNRRDENIPITNLILKII